MLDLFLPDTWRDGGSNFPKHFAGCLIKIFQTNIDYNIDRNIDTYMYACRVRAAAYAALKLPPPAVGPITVTEAGGGWNAYGFASASASRRG